MLKMYIEVDNIKCGGCVNSIIRGLKEIQGVRDVEVDLEKSSVSIVHQDFVKREQVLTRLKKMGYPEKGQGDVVDKVRSYTSCMVGRFSESEVTTKS